MQFRPLIIMSLLLAAVTAEAQVYKWVDENGKVHFGDQPPRKKPDAAEKVELKVAPKTGNAPAASQADRGLKQRELLKTMEQERKQRESQRTKAKEEKKRKAALCKKLKAKRDEMVRANAIYTTNENGERVYMDEEQGAAFRKELVARYKRECAE